MTITITFREPNSLWWTIFQFILKNVLIYYSFIFEYRFATAAMINDDVLPCFYSFFSGTMIYGGFLQTSF